MSTMGLSIRNLSVHYGKSVVVDSFSLEVHQEVVVLFGPSGCGKTSILKAILGVSNSDMHVEGQVLLDGLSLLRTGGAVGMVFQGPVLPSWMTVSTLCGIGRRIRRFPKGEQRARIDAILRRFDIANLANKYPYQLSGGQKQRVAVAVTLINEPSVLLLDEPTTFLDGVARLAVWDFIETHIYPLKVPTIIVSHDPAEAFRLADRIIVLDSYGRIRTQLTVDEPHPRVGTVFSPAPLGDLRMLLTE